MPVQAIATVASGAVSIPNVDITPVVTFTSSTPLLAVSQQGVVSVAQSPAGAATGRISVAELVTGTTMQVSPLSVEVLTSEVSAPLVAFKRATGMRHGRVCHAASESHCPYPFSSSLLHSIPPEVAHVVYWYRSPIKHCVQVCVAALHPVAVGATQCALQQSPAIDRFVSLATPHLMNMEAVVSQHFTDEHVSGAAAVYVQYGSGRVADVTTNPHTTVASLDENLVTVQGFSGEWFSLKVCCRTAAICTPCLYSLLLSRLAVQLISSVLTLQ